MVENPALPIKVAGRMDEIRFPYFCFTDEETKIQRGDKEIDRSNLEERLGLRSTSIYKDVAFY